MRRLLPYIKIPQIYRNEFSKQLHEGNAQRMNMAMVIIAIFELCVFFYELFIIDDKTHYTSTMVTKLGIVIISVLGILIIRYVRRHFSFKVLRSIIYTLTVTAFAVGVLNTFIVQNIVSEVTIFLVVLFTVTVVVRLNPIIAFPIYLTSFIALMIGLPFFQSNQQLVISGIMNSAISISIAYVMSYMLYYQSSIIFLDKKRIAEQNQRLTYLANHDFLTGMMNHKRINQQLEQLKLAAKTNRSPLSIAVIDIDDFKKINDTFGHKQGDNVIKLVARFIHEHFNSSSYIGRYGGDEFLIIMPNTSIDDAHSICQELVEKINSTSFEDITLSISCGLSQLDDENYHQLLECADFKMYEAKSSGKNNLTM